MQLSSIQFNDEVDLNRRIEEVLVGVSAQGFTSVQFTEVDKVHLNAHTWLNFGDKIDLFQHNTLYRDVYFPIWQMSFRLAYPPSQFASLWKSFGFSVFYTPLQELLLKRAIEVFQNCSKTRLVQVFIFDSLSHMYLLDRESLKGDLVYTIEKEEDILYYLMLNLKHRDWNVNDVTVTLCGRGGLYQLVRSMLKRYFELDDDHEFTGEQLHYPELKQLAKCG